MQLRGRGAAWGRGADVASTIWLPHLLPAAGVPRQAFRSDLRRMSGSYRFIKVAIMGREVWHVFYVSSHVASQL